MIKPVDNQSAKQFLVIRIEPDTEYPEDNEYMMLMYVGNGSFLVKDCNNRMKPVHIDNLCANYLFSRWC